MIGSRIDRARALLAPFLEAGVFGLLEVHATDRIAGAGRRQYSDLDALSIASAVWATQQGHVCFDLSDTTMWDRMATGSRPDVDAWTAYMESSDLVHCATSWSDPPNVARPLVFHDRRLFLARQWIDEGIVADRLRARIAVPRRTVDSDIVDVLFSPEDRREPQHSAVLESLAASTSILTGGPGTGKTFTIARILVAAVRSGVRSIALAAPTAKAAVQMRDSLTAALGADIAGLEPEQRRLLEKVEPTTIHRLLGHRAGSSTRFRHDATFPLPHDLVVVDEMSMVSLPLMARLLEAVDVSTRLVLVGDPGQLDSVENGSILRDLSEIDLGPTVPMTVLRTSRRNAGTRSSAFADAVRAGDAERCVDVLAGADTDGTLRWIETADPLGAAHDLTEVISAWRRLRAVALAGDVETALTEVNNARVLCPHREGAHGVDVWNEALRTIVDDSRERWRIGDIVVKTRNDIGQGLSNGDIGIVVRLDGALVFAFRHGESAIHVPVAVDDAVELGFATTVHKAQGSEFGTVAVVVPPVSSPLNTRELLYTAMTRAKPNAVIIGTREDIAHAITTQRRRSSGLTGRLSEDRT